MRNTNTDRNGYAVMPVVHGITETVLDSKTTMGVFFKPRMQFWSDLCAARLLRQFHTTIYTNLPKITRLANNKYLNILFSLIPSFFPFLNQFKFRNIFSSYCD